MNNPPSYKYLREDRPVVKNSRYASFVFHIWDRLIKFTVRVEFKYNRPRLACVLHCIANILAWFVPQFRRERGRYRQPKAAVWYPNQDPESSGWVADGPKLHTAHPADDYGIVMLEKRNGDYMAFVSNNRTLWACGKTQQSAVGELWRVHGGAIVTAIAKIRLKEK